MVTPVPLIVPVFHDIVLAIVTVPEPESVPPARAKLLLHCPVELTVSEPADSEMLAALVTLKTESATLVLWRIWMPLKAAPMVTVSFPFGTPVALALPLQLAPVFQLLSLPPPVQVTALGTARSSSSSRRSSGRRLGASWWGMLPVKQGRMA